VNKPLDQSGEYVDKSVADEMLFALKSILESDNLSGAERDFLRAAIKSSTN